MPSTMESFAKMAGVGAMATGGISKITKILSGEAKMEKNLKKRQAAEAKDQTKKELSEFIESMNTTQFKKVQQFFDTMPKLKHEIKIKNPKTKKESEIVLSGLNDFFG